VNFFFAASILQLLGEAVTGTSKLLSNGRISKVVYEELGFGDADEFGT